MHQWTQIDAVAYRIPMRYKTAFLIGGAASGSIDLCGKNRIDTVVR